MPESTWLIAPAVLLKEGVFSGALSIAPEYVSRAVLAESVSMWNGRPVMFQHPQLEDNFVSANRPDILLGDRHLGYVFNARMEKGSLIADLYLHPKRLQKHNIDLTKRVNEVSVGVSVEMEFFPGAFNSENPDAVFSWRNIEPDHLAILAEDEIGACSIEAGCGTPRVNQRGKDMPEAQLRVECEACPHKNLAATAPKPADTMEELLKLASPSLQATLLSQQEVYHSTVQDLKAKVLKCIPSLAEEDLTNLPFKTLKRLALSEASLTRSTVADNTVVGDGSVVVMTGRALKDTNDDVFVAAPTGWMGDK